MLSQHDRQALAEIEEHFRIHDPDLVRQFDQAHSRTPQRRRMCRTLGLAGLLMAVLLGVTALLARNADAAVSAMATLLVDVLWWSVLVLATLIRSRVGSHRSCDRDDNL